MPTRIVLNKALRSAMLRRDSMPDYIEVGGRKYSPQSPLNAGHKAVVWKVTDEYGRPRAAKFAIYKDYEDRSFLQEMTRAASLERYFQFARLDAADIISLHIASQGTSNIRLLH